MKDKSKPEWRYEGYQCMECPSQQRGDRPPCLFYVSADSSKPRNCLYDGPTIPKWEEIIYND
ncbi:MAG: hypothetical protein KAS32_02480 [Candidatus Peribacteraceae bacterium]|nr:hypothetical protein [Candidatus Peribacteraceae bacterium]